MINLHRSLLTALIGAVIIAPCAVWAAPTAPAPTKPVSPAPTPPKPDSTPSVTPPDVPANHPGRAAVDGMVKKQIMRPDSSGKFNGSKPVTRYELAVILDKLITYVETSQKPIKESKFPVPTGSLTAPNGHWAHDAQERLVRDGFVPTSSPLLKKPGTEIVVAKELAQVLATVSTRLTDRSLPVTKDASPVD